MKRRFLFVFLGLLAVAVFVKSAAAGTLLGDVNLDGDVNLLDVAPLVDRITDGTFQAEADVTWDGEVNLLDVAPFVDILSGDNPNEVVLRDSIGPDSSSTDVGGFINASDDGSGPNQIVISEDLTQDMLFSYLRVIMVNDSPFPLNWEFYPHFNIRVWDSWTAAFANPNYGNIVTLTPSEPTVGPTPFGTVQTQFGLRTSYELIFDITPYNVFLPAGSTLVVGYSTGDASSGTVAVVESDEAGAMIDRGYFTPNWIFTSDGNNINLDGRMGFELRGITQ